MKNTKRAFAAVALAAAAVTLSGASHAVADTPAGDGILNTLGIAGTTDSNRDSSSRDHAGEGNDQRSSSGSDSNSTTTISGNTSEQSVGS
ncbi:hypothetical protein [Streptomyces sp. NPDC093600]|uniref:hypothetical protein n=1 Tax=Streptomyces sp. NPDC093600 TaxID=3366047 RepID=UPI0037F711C8